MKKKLEDAIALASFAHSGQTDKVQQPYILHPLRVMLALCSPKDRIVGVLHDVVEDTDVTLDDLRNDGYEKDIIEAIDSVTKREGESWEKFIERAGQNEIGRRVKICDISDNMSPFRHIGLDLEKRTKLLKKYKKALTFMRVIQELSKREWINNNIQVCSVCGGKGTVTKSICFGKYLSKEEILQCINCRGTGKTVVVKVTVSAEVPYKGNL